MVDKQLIAEELIELLQPVITNALAQTTPENREDLRQELHKKIIIKVLKEDVEKVPDFFEMINSSKEEAKTISVLSEHHDIKEF
ncbi:hypothetical protein [Salimicrobium salexigens]|uniref:Uncharacterized protein n=1 Tax=Salimicrobium salexigens TaxID=908941 RepID=A0ABY1KQY8_9BACI|nr:hypothetical protein [Salimicrobium salexigens]SIS66787.1 hypothetical protein SAMN05421758_103279 [Salimicrobium salexigens]